MGAEVATTKSNPVAKSTARRLSSEIEIQQFGALTGEAAPDPMIQPVRQEQRSLTPLDVVHLQRAVGNHAVGQLLAARGGHAPSPRQSNQTGGVQPGPALNPQAAPAPVQRTQNKPGGGKVSTADPTLPVNAESGVITAVAASTGFGHTFIYIEQLSGDYSIDLTAGGIGASGSESETRSTQVSGVIGAMASGGSGTATFTGAGLEINIKPVTPENLGQLSSAGSKRSWARSLADLTAAYNKAVDMKGNLSRYVYTLAGTGFTWSKKKAINCAKLGEDLLKAAGVSVSAGLLFKTPAQLVTGKRKFMTKWGKRKQAPEAEPIPAPRQDPDHVPAAYAV